MTMNDRAVPERYRRIDRAGGVALLLVALGFIAAAAATTHWAWLFVAIWPGALGLFLVIAYKPGATQEWVHRWLR